MHTTEIVNWKTFKEKLFQNPELDLQFQYAGNKRIDASYHITEIKQAPITSVDCGGVLNRWTEIIIQLWEPENQQQLRAMKVKKALSIVELVEKALPLDETAIVKIEFGNSTFDTRQLIPNEILIDNEDLIIDLRPDAVQCKAIDRGESCGLPAEKSKIELKNLSATSYCAPGSGCC